MEKIRIEETTLKHLSQIDKIQKMYEHEILSLPSIKKDFESNTYYYVSAILDNDVIGFAGISLLVDHADILAIAVSKEYTRQNVGSKLLEHIISLCLKMDMDKIFLEVRPSNIAAIKLYEKFGFEKIGERKNYYTDNHEDALIYKKELLDL